MNEIKSTPITDEKNILCLSGNKIFNLKPGKLYEIICFNDSNIRSECYGVYTGNHKKYANIAANVYPEILANLDVFQFLIGNKLEWVLYTSILQEVT